jgi:hypothetical protein
MSSNQDQAYAAYLASNNNGKYNTRHLQSAKAPEGPEVMRDLKKSDFFDGPLDLGNMGPRRKIPYFFNDPHRKVPEGPEVMRDLKKSDFFDGSGKIKSRKNKKSRKSRKNNKSRKSRKNNKSRKNKK